MYDGGVTDVTTPNGVWSPFCVAFDCASEGSDTHRIEVESDTDRIDVEAVRYIWQRRQSDGRMHQWLRTWMDVA